MLQRIVKFLFVYLVLVASQTWAQTTITIQVGDTGSFYDPPVVAASVGDIINFQWTGMFHSVTQSGFDNPCTPLEGGFDSQFQGNEPGVPLVLPQWNLTITNETETIWFFCKATKPTSHCTSGMVGAINAPLSTGNQSYNAFLAKAKSLTSIPPVVMGSPVLTGVGAFATSPPANSRFSANTTSSVPLSTSSSSSSSIPSSTPTSKPSSGLSTGAKGGIIGGIVGVILIIILAVLLIMSWRRSVKYRRAAVDQMRYLPPTQEIFHARSNPSMSLGRRRSLGSTADSLDRDGSGIGSGSGSGSQTLNVKELAAEIARNMRQEHVVSELPHTQNQYPAEMPSPPLAPVPEHGYTLPSPGYNSEFFQPPTPDSATTLLSQQQSSRSYSTQSRQLPRPPPPSSMPPRKRPMDAMSVDTLPAYGSSHH